MKPSKKSKDGGAKGSVEILKESFRVGCVAQDSYPRKSVLREQGKLGSNHAVILQRHLASNQHSGKKGPSRGIIPNCEPHERSPCAPKSEERSHEETLHQEGCARKAAWDLAKKCLQSHKY